jgi:hypothetical protein
MLFLLIIPILCKQKINDVMVYIRYVKSAIITLMEIKCFFVPSKNSLIIEKRS